MKDQMRNVSLIYTRWSYV